MLETSCRIRTRASEDSADLRVCSNSDSYWWRSLALKTAARTSWCVLIHGGVHEHRATGAVPMQKRERHLVHRSSHVQGLQEASLEEQTASRFEERHEWQSDERLTAAPRPREEGFVRFHKDAVERHRDQTAGRQLEPGFAASRHAKYSRILATTSCGPERMGTCPVVASMASRLVGMAPFTSGRPRRE